MRESKKKKSLMSISESGDCIHRKTGGERKRKKKLNVAQHVTPAQQQWKKTKQNISNAHAMVGKLSLLFAAETV